MPVDWRSIDERWQRAWEDLKIFEADPDLSREKVFVTFPFPYMSGPLHVGSGFTAVRLDVYARYKRMKGFNVLFPWAWHWTGKTVAGASERVKLGDAEFIRVLKEVDGVPEEHLAKFTDPVYMAKYYTDYNRIAVKRFGLSLDWRREFHTSSHHPAFSKFVQWQYERLRDGGYIVKGTHPVVWCPKDESPTGDADRLEGEGVRPTEFALIKFRMGEVTLPCATLRPETIYGVTNLWVNPDVTYVKAKVDGEMWIVSKGAAFKLSHQAKRVKVLEEVQGRDLVGKVCEDPINKRELLILPAWFVNPDQATGLVYSVPAHAPYDWLGLRDLQRNPGLGEAFGIPASKLREIKPISIIRVEGYGDHPALEIVDAMGIADQHDPKADEATKEIYKKEYNFGVLKENCGKYAGRRVADVKDELIANLKGEGIAGSFYELLSPVVCRCTTPCIVKIVEDQWFLNYSSPVWKDKVRKAISVMKFYPPEVRKNFEDVVEWLQDWASTRKTGLGTPLPWDDRWLVETLSDSTVYMAFYPIAKYVNEYGVKPERLIPEVFDYVFYGKGDPKAVSSRSGISIKTLEDMREEFLYWYPVDLRNSGKDLVANHLTFYIFHHVALFEEQHWPRVISVNGFMTVEGEPMHKSKGNFIPLRAVVEEHGADPVRCTLILAAEGLDDPEWRWDNLRDVKSKLEHLYNIMLEIKSLTALERNHIDKWLLSTLQEKIKRVGEAIEVMKTRTALNTALYEVWNDLRWYYRRSERPNGEVLKEFADKWIRLLAPFAPHLAEEMWSLMGNKGLVALAPWPEYDEAKVDHASEEAEELVRSTLEDVQELARVIKIAPKKIILYTAASWKWDVYVRALAMAEEGRLSDEALRKELMEDDRMKAFAKQLTSLVPRLVRQIMEARPEVRRRRLSLNIIGEESILSQAKDFFEKEFKAEVMVYYEGDPAKYDPKGRASLAMPYRPAIYLE